MKINKESLVSVSAVVLFALFCFVICGCESMSLDVVGGKAGSAATNPTANEMVTYDKDYAAVWQALIQGLTEMGLEIDRSDKESGLITTRSAPYKYNLGTSLIYGGKINQRMQIFVKKVTDNKTQLTVQVKRSVSSDTYKYNQSERKETEDISTSNPGADREIRGNLYQKLNQILNTVPS
jgi:hypothetical protein